MRSFIRREERGKKETTERYAGDGTRKRRRRRGGRESRGTGGWLQGGRTARKARDINIP